MAPVHSVLSAVPLDPVRNTHFIRGPHPRLHVWGCALALLAVGNRVQLRVWCGYHGFRDTSPSSHTQATPAPHIWMLHRGTNSGPSTATPSLLTGSVPVPQTGSRRQAAEPGAFPTQRLNRACGCLLPTLHASFPCLHFSRGPVRGQAGWGQAPAGSPLDSPAPRGTSLQEFSCCLNEEGLSRDPAGGGILAGDEEEEEGGRVQGHGKVWGGRDEREPPASRPAAALPSWLTALQGPQVSFLLQTELRLRKANSLGK